MTFAFSAKVILHGACLMAGMTLGAREGVDVLAVEVAIFAGHFQVTPDRFGKIWRFLGESFLLQFFVWTLLHDCLLFLKLHCNSKRLAEVSRISSFL